MEQVAVLIVDDSRNNLIATQATLRGLEVEIVTATSGAEAIQAVLEREFAVILLDVVMPGMDGIQAAELIRRREKTRDIPIIFVTGHAEPAMMIRAYALGAVDFLHKPLLAEALRAKVGFFADLYRKKLAIADHERKERERAIADARQRWAQEALVAADRRKTAFMATLAHELRNPLAPLVYALTTLKMEERSEAVQRTCEIMERQVQQLTRLVDDLLDLSRIATGKLELRKERVDLRKVIETAIDMSRVRESARSHAFDLDLPSAPITVEIDPARVAQIVSNLLNNAAKFTPHGGKISLESRIDHADLVIRVCDDGNGVPPELVGRVFDLYFQADQPTERSNHGLGIGLALVKRLVELHGGSVVLESDGQGCGTKVTVRLPADPRSASVTEFSARTPDAASSSAGLRILVVEDNPDIRETLTRLLERLGHEVDVATDGPSGVAEIESARHDVALVNIELPGMDGYAVARTARQHQRPMRLIAMTGYGQVDDRARAFEAGFDAHLVKPVDPGVLTRVLAEGA
jgi:signal transduction histidine kinase